MASLGSAVLELRTDGSDLEKGLKGAERRLGAFAKLALAAGTAVLGIGVASVKFASDFETAMAQAATLTPAVRDNIAAISKQVLALSQHMGVDATQSATALYEAISAGVPAENAIDFLRVATRSAIAGVTDTATSVRGLTTVLNAYKLPASEAAKVSDIMFQTVNLGVVRFEELNASMSQVIPMAAALGVGFADVGAAVATITKQGTPAAQATTQINAAMVALQRTTPEMDRVLKNLGFTTGTAALEALGFQGTMEALRAEADRLGIPLIELTGRLEGTQAMLQLTGKNAAGARSDLDAIRGSAGSTDNAFEIMNATMNRSVESLLSSFKVIAIEIGSKLIPAITPLIKQFAEWLPGAMVAVQKKIEELRPVFEFLGGVIKTISDVVIPAALEAWRIVSETFKAIARDVVPPVTAVIKFLGENWESTAFAMKAIALGVVLPMFVVWEIAATKAALATIIAFFPIIATLAAVGLAAFLLHKVWSENMGGIQERTATAVEFWIQAFENLRAVVLVIWRAILSGIALAVNGVIIKVNDFIGLYNALAEKLGLPLIGKVEVFTPNIGEVDRALDRLAADRYARINVSYNMPPMPPTPYYRGPFASGTDHITRGPELFLAGEAGPERVEVTPLARGTAGMDGRSGAGAVDRPIVIQNYMRLDVEGRQLAYATNRHDNVQARRMGYQ